MLYILNNNYTQLKWTSAFYNIMNNNNNNQINESKIRNIFNRHTFHSIVYVYYVNNNYPNSH